MRLEDIPKSYIYLPAILACLLVFYAVDASTEEAEESIASEAVSDGRTEGVRFDVADGRARQIAAVPRSAQPLSSPFEKRVEAKTASSEDKARILSATLPLPPAPQAAGERIPQAQDSVAPVCKGVARTGTETILFLHHGGQDFALGVGEAKHGITLLGIEGKEAHVDVHGIGMYIATGD